MYLIDLTGEHHPAQLTYTWEGELNGNQSLSAEVKPSKVNLKFLHDLTEMWTIVVDDVEYKIVYLKKNGEGKLLKASIKAIPLFFDKFNTQRVHKRVDQHMTANAFFTFVFHEPDELGNPSGYNFILNGSFDAIQWEGLAEGDTRLKMFQDGLNRYKAEFRIVGNTIYLENMIGIDSQFRYEHRLNSSNIVQEIDASEMWTYAKGYGDYGDGEGGEDWQDANLIREYTSPLAQIPAIGIREAPPIKNGNITSQSTMDSQLKILVDESLKISVTADIHDLRNQGYPIAQSSLGDRVFLIDPRIGFDEEIRVVYKSETRNWKKELIDLKLTFGVPGLVKRHQSSLNAAVKSINDLLEGKRKLPFSVYDNAVQEATKRLHGITSQLSVPPNGGLMAVDDNNPNNLVLFNAAGLGVSDDGGATFKQSITGLGVVAETIIGKILIGQNLLIENENSSFFVDANGVRLNGAALQVTNGGIRDNYIQSANKWNGQGTYIDSNGIYTGRVTANQIAGGTLQSLNGNFVFNMNGSRMDFYSSALIRFHTGSNQLYRLEGNNAASVSFPTSQGTNIPMMVVGVDSSGGIVDANSPSFVGLRVHNRSVDHSINMVTRDQFFMLSRPDHTNGGFVFRTGFVNDVSRSIYPYNNDNNWTYNLGRSGSQWRWSNVYLKSQPDVQSDERLKTDIRNNDLGLDFIKDIETKVFRMIHQEDQRKQFGIIAQQLINTLENHGENVDETSVVNQGEDGMYGVQHSQLFAPIIKSIQEISERMEALENGAA